MNIKAKYLLLASLETLHFETKEWIEEVRFWFDEMEILNELVDRKLAHNNQEDQMHSGIQLNLNTILDQLSNRNLQQLLEHERYLSSLYAIDQAVKEGTYRESHKKFSLKMIHLKNDVRAPLSKF